MSFQDDDFKGKLERAFAALQDLRYITQYRLQEFDEPLKASETVMRGMLKMVRTEQENAAQNRTDRYN